MSLSNDRLSDVVFNSLNRLHIAKNSGGLAPTELAEIIEDVGTLFANKITQGKVTEEEIQSVESFIPYSEMDQGLSENYFAFKHERLNEAAKAFIQGDAVAIQKQDIRNFMAKPLFEPNDYREGFKRL